jgi:hypothetical protein
MADMLPWHRIFILHNKVSWKTFNLTKSYPKGTENGLSRFLSKNLSSFRCLEFFRPVSKFEAIPPSWKGQ